MRVGSILTNRIRLIPAGMTIMSHILLIRVGMTPMNRIHLRQLGTIRMNRILHRQVGTTPMNHTNLRLVVRFVAEVLRTVVGTPQVVDIAARAAGIRLPRLLGHP